MDQSVGSWLVRWWPPVLTEFNLCLNLLEGYLMASDRTPECLQSHQSARTLLSIKDHSTIWSRGSLHQGEHIHNMNSVVASFLITCIPDEFCSKQCVKWSEKVLSSIDIEGVLWHWVWGEHCRETAMGGDNFHGDTWCANKSNESMFVGLMRIAG